MSNALLALLDLISIAGWILIGISGLILKDIMRDAKLKAQNLRWEMMYLILPLLLLYPSFLFYQYVFGDVLLSKKIISSLIALLAIGCLMLLYLAHQIRLTQLKREISGVAASILAVYLGLSVYISFQVSDFGEMLNNLLFSTSMFMLALALYYFGNYTLAFSKVVRVSRLLYIAGTLMLVPGIVRAFLVEPTLLALLPDLFLLKAAGSLGIMAGGLLMFFAADEFKRRVLEFEIRLK